MQEFRDQYVALYGDDARAEFVADLMRGDPATFKAGYSRASAEMTADEVFGTETQ